MRLVAACCVAQGGVGYRVTHTCDLVPGASSYCSVSSDVVLLLIVRYQAGILCTWWQQQAVRSRSPEQKISADPIRTTAEVVYIVHGHGVLLVCVATSIDIPVIMAFRKYG